VHADLVTDLFNTPLAMLPSAASALKAAALAGQLDEEQRCFDPYFIAANGEKFSLASRPNASAGKLIGVVPIFGSLFQHSRFGQSTTRIGRDFKALDADPSVGTILLEIHSPGGQVWGTAELADTIYAARRAKRTRIVAVANSMAASAALWIGSAAEELVVTPGGEVGSIGVLMMHVDESKFLDDLGVKVTLLAKPSKKIDGNPFEALSETARAEFESDIDTSYRKFVKAMARNRNTRQQAVEATFGGGGMLDADEAVAVGLADRVATIDEVLAELRDPERATSRRNLNRLRLATTDN
jgi:signal peptide peptidase SppA